MENSPDNPNPDDVQAEPVPNHDPTSGYHISSKRRRRMQYSIKWKFTKLPYKLKIYIDYYTF